MARIPDRLPPPEPRTQVKTPPKPVEAERKPERSEPPRSEGPVGRNVDIRARTR